MDFTVGIDWATQAHQVCILSSKGVVVEEKSIKHSSVALQALADSLWALCEGQPDRVGISIEVPMGTVVETLMDRGFPVYAINPKQLDRFRDRHTLAGSKDDQRDAFVLADSLRTDLDRYRRIRLPPPLVLKLRALARTDDDLRQQFFQLANRFREHLHRLQPEMLRLCPAADKPWLWDLWELAPTPDKAQRLPASSVQDLLRAHRIRRLTCEDVLAALKSQPFVLGPGVVEATVAQISPLVSQLRLVSEQRKTGATDIVRVLDDLATEQSYDGRSPDVEVLRSLPGVGPRIAATLLAEAWWLLEQRNYLALRAYTGIAPVTRQSGKRRIVLIRRGCHHRLRHALYHCARVAAVSDAPSRAYYDTLRQRGHGYARCLRSVGDRLLRILVAMLESGTPYDVTRFRSSADTNDSR